MLKFFQKNFPVGVDISDYSIEVLQLNLKKEVLAYGRIFLEEGIVQEGKIVQKEKLGEKLKEVLRTTKPMPLSLKRTPLQAIMSLPESKVFLHRFEFLHPFEKKDFEQQILQEAAKIIPWDAKDLYWDYEIFQDNEYPKPEGSPGQKSFEVLYVGVLKEIVDDYVEAMRKAGLELIIIDIESASLGRALFDPGALASHKALFIMDIGAKATMLSIFDSRELLKLSVVVRIGGEHFTNAIAEKLHIKRDAAEKLKRTLGFGGKKEENKIFPVLHESFEKIVQEARSAIAYFEGKTGKEVEKIILAGGSALLPSLDGYLQEEMKRKVVNPAGNSWDEKGMQPILFANAMGLALRGIEDRKKGINLLPKRERARFQFLERLIKNFPKAEQFFRKYAILFAVILLVAIGFFVYRAMQTQEMPQLPSPESPNKEIELPMLAPIDSLEQIEGSIIKEEPDKIKITDTPTGWLHVREGPATTFPAVKRIFPGETYVLLEEQEGWYKIQLDETKGGWVTSRYAHKVE